MFNFPFFKSFPITVIASGHYSRDYNFDIQKTFEAEWIGYPTKVGKSWYNLHYSTDEKRLLIHTRQLSTSVSNDLIKELSNVIKEFLNKQK